MCQIHWIVEILNSNNQSTCLYKLDKKKTIFELNDGNFDVTDELLPCLKSFQNSALNEPKKAKIWKKSSFERINMQIVNSLFKITSIRFNKTNSVILGRITFRHILMSECKKRSISSIMMRSILLAYLLLYTKLV